MGMARDRSLSEPGRRFAEAREFLSTPGAAEERTASGERIYSLKPRGTCAAPKDLAPNDSRKHEAAARLYNAAVALIECSEAIANTGASSEADQMMYLCLYCHYKWQVLLNALGGRFSSISPFGTDRDPAVHGLALQIFETTDHAPFEAHLRAMGWSEP